MNAKQSKAEQTTFLRDVISEFFILYNYLINFLCNVMLKKVIEKKNV